MNVREALTELRKIAYAETRLLIECPHCGRSGELGAIRAMVVVNAAPSSAQAPRPDYSNGPFDALELQELREHHKNCKR